MIINELTSRQLIDLSKGDDKLSRYRRRIQVRDATIYRVGILEIMYLDQPDLDLYFEVNKYIVTLRLLNFMKNLRSMYYLNLKLIDETGGTESAALRKIVQMTLDDVIESNDIQVMCTCPDFTYRFAYVATVNHYKFGDPQTIRASKTNPDNQGSVCKHVLKVITKPSSWKAKVVTAILRIIKKNPRLLGISV